MMRKVTRFFSPHGFFFTSSFDQQCEQKSHKSRLIKKNLAFFLPGIHLMGSSLDIWPLLNTIKPFSIEPQIFEKSRAENSYINRKMSF